MARIKRDLKKKPIVQKTVGCGYVVDACEKSDKIGDVSKELADFKAAIAALDKASDEAESARSHAIALTLVQERAEEEWNRAFESLCLAIESNTKGDKSKMMSSALDTYERGHKPRLGRLEAPQDLRAKPGLFPETVVLTWQKVRGKLAYTIQVKPFEGGDDAWTHAGMATACKFTVKGLESGKKYWFRVAAIGTAGPSPWSGVENCMAM